jgi:hypothetical protein
MSDGESKHRGGAKVRRNRSFAVTGNFAVSGRIPRSPKGTATGTVHESHFESTTSPGGANGICDTGVVSWTATRTNKLSGVYELK